MKKKLSLLLLLITITITLTGCGNKKYQGYWCNYKELSTIVVQFKDDHSQKNVDAVAEKAATYDNVSQTNYITREDYAEELQENLDDMDIHDTFVIYFDSIDSIGTYIEELKSMKGILTVDQNYAKSNMELYNLKKWGKYEFQNSDEARKEDVEYGSYSIKKGIIKFTRDGDKQTSRILYIKDNHLCADAECNKIFAESNDTCSTRN